MVPLFRNQPETLRDIDRAGGMEDVVGPEHHPPIASIAGEIDGIAHQRLAQPQPLRTLLDQHEPELRGRFVLFDDEGGAGRGPFQFGDETALAAGLEVAQEFGGNLGNERLEALIPAIFFGIEPPMSRDHPADIARPVLADHGTRTGLPLPRKKALRRGERINQRGLLGERKPRQDRPRLGIRRAVDRCEGSYAFIGQLQAPSSRVDRRAAAVEPSTRREALQDARQIGRVEIESPGQFRRPPIVALRQLVDYPRFRQRHAGATQAASESADPESMEAVEPADRRDGFGLADVHDSPPTGDQ